MSDQDLCDCCAALDIKHIIELGPKAGVALDRKRCSDMDLKPPESYIRAGAHDLATIRVTQEQEEAPCPLCRLFYYCQASPLPDCRQDEDARLLFMGKPAQDWWCHKATNYYCFGSRQSKGFSAAVPGDEGHSWTRKVDEQANLSLLKEWIQDCKREHKPRSSSDLSMSTCKTIPDAGPSSDRLGASFMEFWDCELERIVRGDMTFEYTALSYVWGSSGTNSAKPTTKNMPKAVRDAVYVTKLIGLRYIWIDRYCVPQTPSSTQAAILQQMATIYSKAALTIVSHLADPGRGLYGVAGLSRKPPPHVQLGPVKLSAGWSLFDASFPVTRSAWNKRGWTYQESICSRRIVFFLEEQIVFLCEHGWCCESLTEFQERDPKNYQSDKSFGRVDLSMQIEGLWLCIGEYVRRQLTFETDILRAFQGVQNLFHHTAHQVRHHWGLPFSVDYPGLRSCQTSILSTVRSFLMASFQHSSSSSIDNEIRTLSIFATFCVSLLWSSFGTEFGRCAGFPSWSWSGWKLRGGLSTPQFTEARTKVSRHDMVWVHTLQDDWIRLDKYHAQGGFESHLDKMSHRIRICTRVASVQFQRVNAETPSEYGRRATLFARLPCSRGGSLRSLKLDSMNVEWEKRDMDKGTDWYALYFSISRDYPEFPTPFPATSLLLVKGGIIAFCNDQENTDGLLEQMAANVRGQNDEANAPAGERGGIIKVTHEGENHQVPDAAQLIIKRLEEIAWRHALVELF